MVCAWKCFLCTLCLSCSTVPPSVRPRPPVHALPGSQHISPSAAQRVSQNRPNTLIWTPPLCLSFGLFDSDSNCVSLHHLSVFSSLGVCHPPCCLVSTSKFRMASEKEKKVGLFFVTLLNLRLRVQTPPRRRAGRQLAVHISRRMLSPSSSMS